MEMEGLAARFGLTQSFPADVEDETRAWLAAPGLDDPALESWLELPFVTIDNASSRDLDQALFVSKQGTSWHIHYALADAAHYVRPGSALFREALARGASYYLPGLSIPMLPRALSEGLVSLNEAEERRALVMVLIVNAAGEHERTELIRAKIRSRAKLTYQGVQRFFDQPEGHPIASAEYRPSLELFAEVGQVLLARAEKRGVIGFHEASVEVKLHDGPQRFRLVRDERNDVERWNEQISLLCNVAGARFLLDAPGPELQPVFRVHPAPEEQRVDDLERVIAALTRSPELDPEQWHWRRGEERLSVYLARLPVQGPHRRLAKAIRRQSLVIHQRSLFAPEAGSHHGIGADAYARFSSPMREIVGIYTHKEALEKLEGTAAPPEAAAADEALRLEVVDAGNRAKELQKQLDKAANKLVIDRFLKDELARPVETRRAWLGTIMGVRADKLYVELDHPPIELKVYTRDLPEGRRFTLDESGTALLAPSGRVFRTGDALWVRVEGHDAQRDRWIITPVEPQVDEKTNG